MAVSLYCWLLYAMMTTATTETADAGGLCLLCHRIENNDEEMEHEKIPTGLQNLRHIFGLYKEEKGLGIHCVSVCHCSHATQEITKQTCILKVPLKYMQW